MASTDDDGTMERHQRTTLQFRNTLATSSLNRENLGGAESPEVAPHDAERSWRRCLHDLLVVLPVGPSGFPPTKVAHSVDSCGRSPTTSNRYFGTRLIASRPEFKPSILATLFR